MWEKLHENGVVPEVVASELAANFIGIHEVLADLPEPLDVQDDIVTVAE